MQPSAPNIFDTGAPRQAPPSTRQHPLGVTALPTARAAISDTTFFARFGQPLRRSSTTHCGCYEALRRFWPANINGESPGFRLTGYGCQREGDQVRRWPTRRLPRPASPRALAPLMVPRRRRAS